MSGKWINEQQKRMYMKERIKGAAQELAAAKAGFSVRSAKRIEANKKQQSNEEIKKRNNPRDPFSEVWDVDLVPLLEKNPKLQAITLLRHLQDLYEDKYPDKLLRTLQRRVQIWRGIYGPEKEIIFRQNHPPGWQALTDFTNCNKLKVTIAGADFTHLL